MNLYQKLLEIQKQVVGLADDKKSFGYKYVSGDKVLSHIKPLMNNYGLLLKQEVLDIDNVRQDYTTRNGEKSEILTRAKMKFTWVDTETGEKDENLFAANGQNDWEKGLGSALTYAERYFLLKYFHIATDKDDIDNPYRKRKEEAKQVKKPTETKAKKTTAKKKTLVSNIDALVEVLNTDKKEKALKQLSEQRYINAKQKEYLSEFLTQEELSKIEIR